MEAMREHVSWAIKYIVCLQSQESPVAGGGGCAAPAGVLRVSRLVTANNTL